MRTLLKGTPWWIHVSMLVSVLLVVGSFLLPPMGIIDSSILAAVGELIGGATLATFVVNIPAYLEAGMKARIARGDVEVSIQSLKNHTDEKDVPSNS